MASDHSMDWYQNYLRKIVMPKENIELKLDIVANMLQIERPTFLAKSRFIPHLQV